MRILKLTYLLCVVFILACNNNEFSSSDKSNPNEVENPKLDTEGKLKDKDDDEDHDKIDPPVMVSGAFLTCTVQGTIGGCVLRAENDKIVKHTKEELQFWQAYEKTENGDLNKLEAKFSLPNELYKDDLTVMFDYENTIAEAKISKIYIEYKEHTSWESSEPFNVLLTQACYEENAGVKLMDYFSSQVSEDYLKELNIDTKQNDAKFTAKYQEINLVKKPDWTGGETDHKLGGINETNLNNAIEKSFEFLKENISSDYSNIKAETKGMVIPDDPLNGVGWVWLSHEYQFAGEVYQNIALYHAYVALNLARGDGAFLLYTEHPIRISDKCLIPK